jgi:DNA polymerase elongation subunit (family B)
MVMLDPDIVAGWDHERYSIAYITHRANEYEMDILTDMSRAQASYELLLVCLEFD